jgi:hypothetical protein
MITGCGTVLPCDDWRVSVTAKSDLAIVMAQTVEIVCDNVRPRKRAASQGAEPAEEATSRYRLGGGRRAIALVAGLLWGSEGQPSEMPCKLYKARQRATRESPKSSHNSLTRPCQSATTREYSPENRRYMTRFPSSWAPRARHPGPTTNEQSIGSSPMCSAGKQSCNWTRREVLDLHSA